MVFCVVNPRRVNAFENTLGTIKPSLIQSLSIVSIFT